MSKTLNLILAAGLLLASANTAQAQAYSGTVNHVAKETDGVYTLNAFGTGKNKEEAVANAKENVISVLLFQGIPGTDISAPLITDKAKALNEHARYFKNMFGERTYERFIMSTYLLGDPKKNKKQAEVEIKINVAALRADLEQNGVTRKFGY